MIPQVQLEPDTTTYTNKPIPCVEVFPDMIQSLTSWKNDLYWTRRVNDVAEWPFQRISQPAAPYDKAYGSCSRQT